MGDIMKQETRLVLILILVMFLAGIQGCKVGTQKTAISSEIRTMFNGTYKVDPYMEHHRPRTVAVLPFIDVSKSKKGTETVRKHFYNHFSSLPFKDMEIFRVDHLLRKAGLTDPDVIHKTTPQKLGEILNVDAVVFGTISNFDKIFAVVYSQVSAGAKIEMYDTKTGNFLWSGEHVARIQEGGISTTPVGIIATVIATSMNVRDIQLLRACDDLFRDMVKTIPTPTIAETSRPPVITLLTQDSKGTPQKAANEIKVVMKGTPGMRAYFDIGDYKKGIDMKEVERGGYLGIYRVVPGDNVERAIITGHLTDDAGNTAQWIDAIGTITIDTTPPAVPEHTTTVGRASLILLEWQKNTEPDLAGYTLYRSPTPLSGFTRIVTTEFNHFRDTGLENYRTYFYKISATDRAGNESKKSAAFSGMPVAPGPTPVAGTIESDTTWYAGGSPYILEDTVKVRDKTLLTIEPGCRIESKGAALVIAGRLSAPGDEQRLIHFSGMNGTRWGGIVFSNVREKENILRFCLIKDSKTGITCESSSPVIEHCEITHNIAGIKIGGAFSKPSITGCIIHNNQATGILITDGARPTLHANRIRDNVGGGLFVSKSEPIITSNTIVQNTGSGITIRFSQAEITGNNIHDNTPFNLAGTLTGSPVTARDNWWGTVNAIDILAAIKGRTDVRSILDSAAPEGKPLELPFITSKLGGTLTRDSYLTLSNSPYRVAKDLLIDNGATLYIEPGVEIRYEQDTSIIAKDGGITAKGTADNPIVFTAAGASPSPGFYANTVRFAGNETTAPSSFLYCIVRFASTAFDIQHGSPDISHCYIAQSSQSGIYCRNDAAPKILYNSFVDNRGEGAIRCVGMSKPVIHHNNFENNSIAIQSFSSIHIDARLNWWGSDPPDRNIIWGTNINIEPWLPATEEKAFPVKQKTVQ